MLTTVFGRALARRITATIALTIFVSVASVASAAVAAAATVDPERDVYVASGGELVANGQTCVAGQTSLRCYEGETQSLSILNSKWIQFPLPDGDFVDATPHGWWVVDGTFATPADDTAAQYASGAISVDELISLTSQKSSVGPVSFFGVAWPYFWGVVALLAVPAFAVWRLAITRRARSNEPDSPRFETL